MNVSYGLVSSTGRRNTLAKSLCWRLEVQRFPRSLIELARHLVLLGLGVRREVSLGPMQSFPFLSGHSTVVV
jgi:hypothetical protein